MRAIKSEITATANQIDAPNWHDNDVVKVIRCKDCKYWEKSHINYNEHICYWGGYTKQEDDFCSWAERKANGETKGKKDQQ